MLNKVQKYFLATVTMATLFASSAFADDADTALDDVEHFTDFFVEDTLKLEKFEVTGDRSEGRKFDDRGTLEIIPRLVVEEGTRRTARHGGYGLIIRPVVEGETGFTSWTDPAVARITLLIPACPNAPEPKKLASRIANVSYL